MCQIPGNPLPSAAEEIFTLSRHHTFNIPMYKIIATCIECATVLQANSMCTTHEYACFPIHD